MFDFNCTTIRDRIDAFVDGELEPGERRALETHCAHCESCARELRAAVDIRDALRALPVLTVPRRVIDAAERDVRIPHIVPMPARRAAHRYVPAIAAALAVIVAGAWFVSSQRNSSPAPGYSDAEIRRASEEMALAFSYVDRYSTEAAELLSDDVLGKRVLPRIERAITTSGEAAVHDALVPGLKRAVRESGLDVTSPSQTRS